MANATFWQDADLLGRINGLDISEEAMFVNRAQNVTGKKPSKINLLCSLFVLANHGIIEICQLVEQILVRIH